METHSSILQQVLQPGHCHRTVTRVLPLHHILHFLHPLLCLLHIREKLKEEGGEGGEGIWTGLTASGSGHRWGTYLEVGCILFQVGFDAAAELKDPAPLSLQGSGEGLRRRTKSEDQNRTEAEPPVLLTEGGGSHLDGLPGRMSVSQQLVSGGLHRVDLLLSKLQLPHQTLQHRTNNQNQNLGFRTAEGSDASKHVQHRVAFFLGGHVGVALAPVVVDLLLLLLV